MPTARLKTVHVSVSMVPKWKSLNRSPVITIRFHSWEGGSPGRVWCRGGGEYPTWPFLRGSYHVTYPMMNLMLPPVYEQTDTYENITFPQLRWRAIKTQTKTKVSLTSHQKSILQLVQINWIIIYYLAAVSWFENFNCANFPLILTTFPPQLVASCLSLVWSAWYDLLVGKFSTSNSHTSSLVWNIVKITHCLRLHIASMMSTRF